MYNNMADLGNDYDDDKKLDDPEEGDVEEPDEDEIVDDDGEEEEDMDDMEAPDTEDDDIESINSEVSNNGESDIDNTEGVEETKGNDDDNPVFTNYLSSDESEEEEDEDYLQKFDEELRTNFINQHHPEVSVHNYEEVKKLATVVRDANGIIIDQLHRTIPIMTKYESTRILGQRAKQIETGAAPLVQVSDTTVDSYVIAEKELREKKIPFIIRRPIPNGGSEYWHAYDLELLH